MNFAEKVKNLRLNAGLTQQQLSNFLGITASAIGFLENGQRDPTGSTLISYAKYFNISIDSLVGLEPDIEDSIFQKRDIPEISINKKNSIFPNRIRELRQNLSLTQSELAQQVGVNQSAIGKYERGELEPGIKALKKLSRIFECSIDYIVGHADDFGNVTVQEAAPTLKNDEKELLELYRKLNYEGKHRLIARAEVMLEDAETKNKYGA